MARKFYTPVSLQGLELTNFKVQNLDANPSPYGSGHVYYNTVANELRMYNGTAWTPVGGSVEYGLYSQIPAAGNEGRLFVDTTYNNLYFDNGSGWVLVGKDANANYVNTVSGTTNQILSSSAAGDITLSIDDYLYIGGHNSSPANGYVTILNSSTTNMGGLTTDGSNLTVVANNNDLQLRSDSSIIDALSHELHLQKTEYWNSGTQYGIITNNGNDFKIVSTQGDIVLDSHSNIVSSTNEFHIRKTEYWDSGTQIGVIANIGGNLRFVGISGSLQFESNSGNVLAKYGIGITDSDYVTIGAVYSSDSNLLVESENGNIVLNPVTLGTKAFYGDPGTSGNEIARISDVHAATSGLNVKNSVIAATTSTDGNQTLTGISAPFVIDGVTLVDTNRVLLKNQNTASENGIYVYTANTGTADGTLTRSDDEQTPAQGDFVYVEQGTVNLRQGWILSTDTTVWVQFSAAGEYVSGDGIDISGQTISAKVDSAYGLHFGAGKIQINNGTGIEFDGVTGAIKVSGYSSLTKKYAANLTGSSTTYTVTHGLGTADVQVTVYDNSTYEDVFADVVRIDGNTITITFAVAPTDSAFRVVVVG